MKKGILLVLFGALALTSCKKEGCTDPNAVNYDEHAKKDNGSCNYDNPVPEPTSPYLALDTAYTSNNDRVILFADEALSAGYSNLYVQIEDQNGINVTGASVTYTPMMDMGTMQHSAPTIQPTFDTSENHYAGVVIFQMSSMGGTWTLDVDVDGSPATFTLNVAEPDTKVVGVYQGTDAINYIVSLVRPVTWETGENDLNIMIHKMETMLSFPAVTDLDIVFTPEMVSMGHGSTGNVDPVHVADGLYSGIVNFNMSGDWRFHLELSRAGTVIHDDAFLDILY